MTRSASGNVVKVFIVAEIPELELKLKLKKISGFSFKKSVWINNNVKNLLPRKTPSGG